MVALDYTVDLNKPLVFQVVFLFSILSVKTYFCKELFSCKMWARGDPIGSKEGLLHNFLLDHKVFCSTTLNWDTFSSTKLKFSVIFSPDVYRNQLKLFNFVVLWYIIGIFCQLFSINTDKENIIEKRKVILKNFSSM